MLIVKSTLLGVNKTLRAVQENEQILKSGLDLLAREIWKRENKEKRAYLDLCLKVTLNEHIQRIDRYLRDLRQQYDIVLEAILNAQKGVLEPHIITPYEIFSILDQVQAICMPIYLCLLLAVSVTIIYYWKLNWMYS